MKGNKLYLGTSGLVLPVPNKQSYPLEFRDKSRLTYYASLFNSLEVNSSFYKVPMASTVARWKDSVPRDFRFTFKMWKGITHNKGLVFDATQVHRFMQVIAEAADRKGCLLIQFPAGTTADHTDRLRALLQSVRFNDPQNQWMVSVEFRHFSWYNDTITELLRGFDMNIVTHDIPASAPPSVMTLSSCVYLRFHGPEKGYKGSYDEAFLDRYAKDIALLLDQDKTVYAYFNNTLGTPIQNLITLRHFIMRYFKGTHS